jgi:hypothetical protein
MLTTNLIDNKEKLARRLYDLHMERKGLKQKIPRKTSLTKNQRIKILEKTGFKCHICGIKIIDNKFQADHVESHCRGGLGIEDNFLPSCNTCNNYRWHYLPEEIHWVLKLGVFAKTQIEKKATLGKHFAESFINYEIRSKKSHQSRKLKSVKKT